MITVTIPGCPLGTDVIVRGGEPVAVVITLIVEPLMTIQKNGGSVSECMIELTNGEHVPEKVDSCP